jgi:6-phospho-3-hexuloisomerase
MSRDLAALIRPLLAEIDDVVEAMPGDALEKLVAAVIAARRVALYGQGRTGLIMQGLTMRLYHLGREAYFVGAMNAPPLGTGDLFLVNAALGDLPTGLALIASARQAGAQVAAITAVPDSPAGRGADLVLHIPAQTMADDSGAAARSRMPMGSQYEAVLFVLCEALVLRLAERLGVSFAAMRERHANLL